MAAGRLIVPGWARALDSDGDPIAAAISLFDTGTSDLASVYTSSALNVPLANPVLSNAAGRFPAIWADDTAEYDWSVVAPYGPPGSPFTGTGLTTATAADVLAADAAEAAAEEAAESAAIAEQALADIIALAEAAPDTDPVVIASKIGYAELAASGGSALVGFLQAGTGAVARTQQDKDRDTVSVLDFIPVAEHAAILAGTSTYNATAAVQAAIDAARKVYFPGSSSNARYNATALAIKVNTILEGDGQRSTRLVQVAGTASNFLTCETGGLTGDITEGAFGLINISVEPADTAFAGIEIGATARGSMFIMWGARLFSQHHLTLGALPYNTTAGSHGIRVNGGGGAFLGSLRDSIVEGFDVGIKLTNVANDWNLDNVWMLDNRLAVYLDGVSIFRATASFESGVTNARCYYLTGTTSNVSDIDSRWELTQAGCFAIEFASFTGTNIRVKDPTVLVASDGGGLPGRKWTGTPPANFLYQGTYTDLVDGAARVMIICPAQNAVALPNYLRVGGQDRGNGRIDLGRNIGGATSVIEHDGTHTQIRAGNSLRLYGDAQTGANYKIDIQSVGVAFNGVNGVGKQTLGAAATDLATVITLANNIRTALINNGLGQN